MNMVSSVRHAFVQQKKQPISLREGQIIQGKITKIYPNNRAAIQIGNHKLIAEITTSLSVGKQYFFQVQKADNVQLRVLGEQHATNKITNMDVALILQQLGLKANKVNQTMIRQLIQDKIPFNKEQIHQAVSLLSKAGDKSEAIELIKNMITLKLPITDATFKALQVNRQESISNLMHQVYNELSQQKEPTAAERTLLHQLEKLLHHSKASHSNTFTGRILQSITPSSNLMNGLKSLGLLDISVTDNEWMQAANNNSLAKNSASKTILQQRNQDISSLLKVPVNQQEVELTRSTMQSLLENGENIQRMAHRILIIFSGLHTASLSTEQLKQATDMIDKELFPMLPRETVQMIQQSIPSQRMVDQGNISSHEQRVLFQILDLFSKGSTFRELASLSAINVETSETQTTNTQQQIATQFLTHLQNYMKLMGLNNENELKLNLDNADQMQALKSDPSIKSMLMNMVQGQEGNRAQAALLHFINGMQMQSITEINNALQASFMLPGEKLSLNQDVYMQFEGKKDKNGNIDSDFCRILFVLELEKMNETMIDMQIQKRIISVNIYNEQKEPSMVELLIPSLKDSLDKLDYQLSAVQWKPLYDRTTSTNKQTDNYVLTENRDRERYDFLI